jgi:hypothetical protein
MHFFTFPLAHCLQKVHVSFATLLCFQFAQIASSRLEIFAIFSFVQKENGLSCRPEVPIRYCERYSTNCKAKGTESKLQTSCMYSRNLKLVYDSLAWPFTGSWTCDTLIFVHKLPILLSNFLRWLILFRHFCRTANSFFQRRIWPLHSGSMVSPLRSLTTLLILCRPALLSPPPTPRRSKTKRAAYAC